MMSKYLDIKTTSTTPKSSKKHPFTSSERELVVALVNERPIIEDKRINAKNIELKRRAWEELAECFNSEPYVFPRNSKQLKRCWENMKSQRKKELSQESSCMTDTGGVPSQGDSSASCDVEDVISPFINVNVPGAVDSYASENSDDLNYNNCNMKNINGTIEAETDSSSVEMNEKCKKGKRNFDAQKGNNRVSVDVETEARLKRCNTAIQQDQELHMLRVEREKILIQREKNILKFEKEMHALQIAKLRLEIYLIKKQK